MGSMVDMVSQFESDDIYIQINYKGNPVRVTPLKYANLIKWFTNQGEGTEKERTGKIRTDRSGTDRHCAKVCGQRLCDADAG